MGNAADHLAAIIAGEGSYNDKLIALFALIEEGGIGGGGGVHPDLAAHDLLGLATQAELNAAIGTAVLKSLFNANTILTADADDTPAPLAVAASTVIGRAAAGNIDDLTMAQLRTLLGPAGVIDATTFLRGDGTWAVPAGGGGGGGGTLLGKPYAGDPSLAASAGNPGARVFYMRAKEAGAITSLGAYWATTGGNMCLAHYSNTGVGRAARPNARQATTGSIATPAVGWADTALVANIAAGDWLAVACDGTAAGLAYSGGNPAGGLPGLQTSVSNGFFYYEEAVFPCPANAALPGAGLLAHRFGSYILVGS